MKSIKYFLFIILVSSNVIAEQKGSSNIEVLVEELRNTQVRGIAYYSRGVMKGFIMDAGFSFNYMSSDIPLEKADRREIFPVYGFLNFAAKMPVSPYVGFGIDIGDLLLDKADEGEIPEVDIYYLIGLRTQFNKLFKHTFL